MGRAEKRRIKRIATEELNNLSPETLKVIEGYALNQVNEQLEVYKKLVDEAVFKAMRGNRISVERANRVMEQANLLMLKEVNEIKAVS